MSDITKGIQKQARNMLKGMGIIRQGTGRYISCNAPYTPLGNKINACEYCNTSYIPGILPVNKDGWNDLWLTVVPDDFWDDQELQGILGLIHKVNTKQYDIHRYFDIKGWTNDCDVMNTQMYIKGIAENYQYPGLIAKYRWRRKQESDTESGNQL